jgi:hypothetical protein
MKTPIIAGICKKAIVIATHAVGQDVSQRPLIVTANVHRRCMSAAPVMLRMAVRAAGVFATPTMATGVALTSNGGDMN